MHDDDKPGRSAKADPVEEAMAESFPASDPPAWTAGRAGKPESDAAKDARKPDETAPQYCEAVGLFATAAAAQSAADVLLASGFNRVDIGPPRWHGNLGAGIGAAVPVNANGSFAVCAALGALAAGAVAALFAPRGAVRHILAASAGGAIGAMSAHTAARLAQKNVVEPGWPEHGTLLRVRLKTPEEQNRALAIIERQGACKLQVSWAQ